MKITDFEAQLAINGFADVDGTRVVSHGVQNVTEAEARAYIAYAKELYPHETITVLKKRPRLKGYAPGSPEESPIPFSFRKRLREEDRPGVCISKAAIVKMKTILTIIPSWSDGLSVNMSSHLTDRVSKM